MRTFAPTLCMAVLLLFGPLLPAQDLAGLQLKYWKHRAQLHGDGTFDNPGYVKVGAGRGMSIPVPSLTLVSRTPNGPNEVAAGVDGTHQLGHYLALLATEFKLLDDHGSDTQNTLRELYHALEAFERLDEETSLQWEQPGAPFRDGFFFRTDIPADFHSREDLRFPNTNIPNFPGYRSTTSGWVSNIDDPASPTSHNVVSQDQLIYMLFGFAMVNACVPDGVRYEGEDIRFKAAYSAHLMINRLSRHGWLLFNPEGEMVDIGGNALHNSYPLAVAMNHIAADHSGIPDNYHNAQSRTSGWGFWAQQNTMRHGTFIPYEPGDLPWNNEVNASMAMTLASLSNTWNLQAQVVRARDMNLEVWPLVQMFLHDLPLVEGELRRDVEELLENAPCGRFCDSKCFPGQEFPGQECTDVDVRWNCQTPEGWRATNRWYHPGNVNGGGVDFHPFRGRTALGDGFGDGDWAFHNGIDFLLLYNLYHLLYLPDEPYYDGYANTARLSGSLPDAAVGLGTGFCEGCHLSPRQYVYQTPVTVDLQVLDGSRSPSALASAGSAGNVTLRGGASILLQPGFKVEAGAYFRAYIDPYECEEETNTFQKDEWMPPVDALWLAPNPTSGRFRVGWGVQETALDWVEVRNIAGVRVWEGHGIAPDTEIVLPPVPAGIYLVRAREGTRLGTQKLVVRP